ncbi:hypothetical protein RFI_19211, partial [Reticulomyxa filosa]
MGICEEWENKDKIGRIKCSIIFLNVHGRWDDLKNVNSALYQFVNKEMGDFMGFCETFKDKIDNNIKIKDAVISYRPAYKKEENRKNWRGRKSNGMTSIVNNKWISQIIQHQFANNNMMTIIIKEHKILIIFIYIPPIDTINIDIIDKTFHELGKLIGLYNILDYLIIVIGDMNARMEKVGDNITNYNGKILWQLTQTYNMRILNIDDAYGKSTYYTYSTNIETSSIIDYIIINNNIRWNKMKPKME